MGAEESIQKEKLIKDTAKKLFFQKGFLNATTQEIADEAGINKALLHYYFHTKEQLFREVFYGVLRQLIPDLTGIFRSDETFEVKIELIVSKYDSYMAGNPILPQFIIREINRDPDQLSGFMSDQGIDFTLLEAMLDREVRAGDIRPITFPHLFANLIGMIVMPYIGRPLFQRKLFMNDPEKYDQFLRERRSVITTFIKQALLTK